MTSTIADMYQEYKELEDELDADVPEMIYEKLMNKEENRLNLINRIVDYKSNSNIIASSILNDSLSNVMKKIVTSWWAIYTDIVYKQITDPLLLFWAGDRKIFVGLFVVLISVVLFFMDISG
jgi:predicted AAA+ superfamily ATPase